MQLVRPPFDSHRGHLDLSSIPAPVLEAVRTLQAAGHQAFLVGGCVRDLLRGAAPKDFDLATSALPAQVQQCFKKVIPTGIQHGTVTVHVGGRQVEVTTFRSEGDYLDGRRPSTVEFHADIEADLSRRDFTMNAIAVDPFTGRVVDPFGGAEDLQRRLVRCVGKPLDRFTEDGLRCLRAVRFATVLQFALDPATEAAIPATVSIFKKVAVERVRDELFKLLLSPHAVRGLGLLRSTGLLGAFLPEAADADFAAVVRVPEDVDARLAMLLAALAEPRPVLERLRLSTRSLDRVERLIANQKPPAFSDSDKIVRLWIRDVGPDPATLAQQLCVSAGLGHDVAAVGPRIEKFRNDPLVAKQLALNGAQIMAALGVAPGPAVGQATRFLLEKVLEDPSKNTPDFLLEILKSFPP